MTQEIIVYRNPFEKDMWDFIHDNPGFFIGLILMMIIFVVSAILIEKLLRWSNRSNFKRIDWNTISTIQTWGAAMIAASFGAYFFFYM